MADGSYTQFIAFGLLVLLLSTLAGLTLMSFLGLYGVFVTGVFSYAVLILALLVNIPNFLLHNQRVGLNFGDWFFIDSTTRVECLFVFDKISFSFSLLTASIAGCVYLYTFSYFRTEPLVERLLLFINLFVLSMLLLVNAGNLVLMFLGWELIGFTSFLLINF